MLRAKYSSGENEKCRIVLIPQSGTRTINSALNLEVGWCLYVIPLLGSIEKLCIFGKLGVSVYQNTRRIRESEDRKIRISDNLKV